MQSNNTAVEKIKLTLSNLHKADTKIIFDALSYYKKHMQQLHDRFDKDYEETKHYAALKASEKAKYKQQRLHVLIKTFEPYANNNN